MRCCSSLCTCACPRHLLSACASPGLRMRPMARLSRCAASISDVHLAIPDLRRGLFIRPAAARIALRAVAISAHVLKPRARLRFIMRRIDCSCRRASASSAARRDAALLASICCCSSAFSAAASARTAAIRSSKAFSRRASSRALAASAARLRQGEKATFILRGDMKALAAACLSSLCSSACSFHLPKPRCRSSRMIRRMVCRCRSSYSASCSLCSWSSSSLA